jgi:hypothetical protein
MRIIQNVVGGNGSVDLSAALDQQSVRRGRRAPDLLCYENTQPIAKGVEQTEKEY